jgi:hypothetical protein
MVEDETVEHHPRLAVERHREHRQERRLLARAGVDALPPLVPDRLDA